MAKKSKGMLTDTMYAGGTPTFDERTGQPRTSGVKGAPIKQAPIVAPTPEPAPTPAPETPAEMTFTFVEGRERGNAAQNYLYGQEGEVQQLTVSELRDYFESDKVNRLPEVFGTFDNYLAYMTEREQLIQSGDYDTGNWAEADAGFSEDQEMILEGDADLTIDPSDPGQNLENLRSQQTSTQQGAYNNWINSEANQALLQKYGVNPVVYSNSGDKFAWNGSAYVKVVDEDHAGFADFVKMGITTAIGIMSGGALAPALGGVGSAVVSNALTQAITTGSIDPDQLLQTAATAGLGQAVSQIIGPQIESALGGIDLSEITGIEEVDNVLNAMGQTAIRQAVFDGELDMDQIVSSGLFAGARELADFILEPIQQFIAENTTASPEAVEEQNRRALELLNAVGEDAGAEVLARMSDSVNTAIADQQNEAIANQLRDLSGNLQAIYEDAYAPTTTPPEDLDASTIDAPDSELADTTADLTGDTTIETEPMQSIMYADETAIPADRVAEILDGSTVVTTLDGSGDYEYGSMELGDTYLAYHTQHVDESGIEYTLIRGSNGRLYVSDGTNLVEYQGASDLTHNNAQISWLDSHLVSGGGLPTDANNAQFLDVTFDVDGAGVDSTSERILANMEEGWQDVNNPTLESSMAGEAPVTPLETEIEVDPFEYVEEPVVTPEPSPEPEPVDVTEPVDQQDQQAGDAGTQPTTPTDVPVTETPPEEETPITSGMFPEYFPEPTPEPGLEPYEQGSLVGDARGLIEQALLRGATVEYLQENFPQYNDLIAEVSQQVGEIPSQQPSMTVQDVENVVNNALSNIPAGTTSEEVSTIVNEAISNISIPASMTEEQVSTIINSAIEGIQLPQGITSEDVSTIVDTAISNIQFPEVDTLSEEEVSTIVDTAIGNITFPEGVTSDQVSTIVETAIGNIDFPQGITSEDVQSVIDTAIGNIQFPEGMSEEEVGTIVGNAISNAGFATPEDIANAGFATPEEVGTAIANSGFATPENVATIISNAGFTTPEDVGTALANAGFATPEDVTTAIANAGFTTPEDVNTALASAGFATPEDVTAAVSGLEESVGGLMTDVAGIGTELGGIGQGLEGLGEGIAGIGEGLGAGLLGLAAQQALMPGQIAALTPIEPVEFEKFQRGLTRRKLADPLRIGMFTGGARSV